MRTSPSVVGASSDASNLGSFDSSQGVGHLGSALESCAPGSAPPKLQGHNRSGATPPWVAPVAPIGPQGSLLAESSSDHPLSEAKGGVERELARDSRLQLNGPRREVWQRAQPFLRDPVEKRYWVTQEHPRQLGSPRSGHSALAHYSMLSEPRNAVFALSRDDWRSLLQHDALTLVQADEPKALNIEVWSYAPTLFSADGAVDRLSLYLSLRQTEDERVEGALERMMEDLPW